MGVKLNPVHILILSVFLCLISVSGSELIVDEEVVVPAYGYAEWPIQVYPGQAVRAVASMKSDDPPEYVNGVLELLVLDEENFQYYESEHYGNITERIHAWIATNDWEGVDVNIRWFGRIHVVLNNKIRALNRDTSKDAEISITVLRPLGYLTFPSVVLVALSLFASYRQYMRGFGKH